MVSAVAEKWQEDVWQHLCGHYEMSEVTFQVALLIWMTYITLLYFGGLFKYIDDLFL